MGKFQDCEDAEAAVLLNCIESLNEIDPLAMQRVIRYLAERCVIRLEAERKVIDESIEWVKREMAKGEPTKSELRFSARRDGIVPISTQ